LSGIRGKAPGHFVKYYFRRDFVMRKLFVVCAVLGLIVISAGVVKAEAASIRLGVTVGPHGYSRSVIFRTLFLFK
jgi:hypothetical protein